MGLDMYLSKRTYVKNWDHMASHERHTITVAGPSAASIKPERITSIEEEVGYWRKANAIHQWFVTHCQGGTDDCRDWYVSRTDLTALLETCTRVLADPTTAAELLPPQSGFFFGSTDIDEYFYWKNVRDTVALLESLLAEDTRHADFYYRSSW
jgi:hypothetical protein